MPGIDDFKDLSNAVTEGGNKMRESLTHAVAAAREMDKVLNSVSKVTDNAKEMRKAIHDANEEFDQMKRASSTIKKLSDSLKKSAEQGKALRDSLGDLDLQGNVKLDVDSRELGRLKSELASMKAGLKVAGGVGGGTRGGRGGVAYIEDEEAIKHLSVIEDSMRTLEEFSSKTFKHMETYDKRRLPISAKQMLAVEKRSARDERTTAKSAVLEARVARQSIEKEQIPSIVVETKDSSVAGRAMAGVIAELKNVEQQLDRMSKIEDATGKDINHLTTEATTRGTLHVVDDELGKEVNKARADAVKASRRSTRTPAGVRAAVQAQAQVKYLEELTSIVEDLPKKLKDAIEQRRAGGMPIVQAAEAEAKGRRGSFSTKVVKAAKAKSKAEAEKEFSPKAAIEQWKKGLEEVSREIDKKKREFSKAGIFDSGSIKEQIVELEKVKARYAVLQSAVGDMEYLDKATLQNAVATKTLGIELERVLKKYPDITGEIEDAVKAAEQLTNTSESLRGAVKLGPFAKVSDSLHDGAEEGKKFAGGMKISGLTMAGAGLAAAYLAKQTGELTGKFKDAAINLSLYNVQTEILSKRMPNLGVTAQAFKFIRNELKLTREQALEFFEVLNEGVISGVATVGQLVDAGSRLRIAFGGDQTKRLKEYVDILKEIPTLDTDLSFTATADDKAATLFALAQRGKLGTVLELRTAGLAGGRGKPLASKEDIEMMNNAQSTDKAVQDIKDGMLKTFFPTWGPQFAAIAENTAKILAAILGGFATLGAINYLTGGTMSQLIKPLIHGLAGKTALKTGVATTALGKSMANFGTAIRTAGLTTWKFAKSTAGFTAILGAGFTLAGMGASSLAEKLDKSSKKTEASFARVSAGALDMAGTIAGMTSLGAMLGTAFLPVPGVGTALGALIGTVIGVSQNAKEMGKEVQKLASSLATSGKYSKFVEILGMATWSLGKIFEVSGNVINKSLSMLGTGFGNLYYNVTNFAKAMGDGIVAFKDWLVYSNEENAKRKASVAGMEGLAESLGEIADVNDVLKMKMNKRDADQDKSWSEFNVIFSKVEIAVKNAKQELFEFRKGLASVQLSNLAEIGGTADQFNRTLAMMTTSVRGRFDMQMKAYDIARQETLKSSNLNASERRMALDKINKAEADATKDFVEGMKAAIEALYRAPGLIAAGLQAKIVKTKFDFQVEAKTMTLDELGKRFSESVETASKYAEETMTAGSKAVTLAAKAQLALAQKVKNQQVEAANSLSESLKKAVDVQKVEAVEFDTSKMGDIPKQIAEQMMKAQVGGAAKGKTAISADAFATLPKEVQKALGETKKIVGTNVKANVEVLNKQLADNENQLLSLGAELDNLSASLPSKELKGISVNLGKLAKRQEKYGIIIEESKKALADMDDQVVDISSDKYTQEKKKLEDTLKAQKEAGDLQDKINQDLAKYKDRVLKGMKDVDREAVSNAIDSIVVALTNGSDAYNSAIKKLQSIKGLEGTEIMTSLNSFANDISEIASLNKTINDKESENENIKKATANTTENINMLNDVELKNVEANLQAQREVLDAIRKRAQLVSSELDDRKRELENIANTADLAGMTGQTLENYLGLIEKQGDVWDESQNVLNEIASKSDAEISGWKSEINDLKKTADDSGKLAEGVETKISYLNGKIKASKDALKEQHKMVADAAMIMLNTAISFQGEMDALSKTVEFREFAAKIDMSGAEMELAQYADNWKEVNKKGFETAVEYGKRRFEMEKMAAEDLEKRIANINLFYDWKIPIGEATEQQRVAAIEAAQAESRLTVAKKETELKKLVVDRAKQEAQYSTDMVDSRQQVADAEAQFLTEIGGDWKEILSLQAESVSLEREKARIANDYAKNLEAHGIRGKELAQAQTSARLAELKYQQKALGAQKSAYEGLLGAAFGAIRSSFGMRKNIDSAVMKMGREDTRVKTRSGLFRGAGSGGKPGTIAERAFANQSESFGKDASDASDSVVSGIGDMSKTLGELLKGKPIEEQAQVAEIKNAHDMEKNSKTQIDTLKLILAQLKLMSSGTGAGPMNVQEALQNVAQKVDDMRKETKESKTATAIDKKRSFSETSKAQRSFSEASDSMRSFSDSSGLIRSFSEASAAAGTFGGAGPTMSASTAKPRSVLSASDLGSLMKSFEEQRTIESDYAKKDWRSYETLHAEDDRKTSLAETVNPSLGQHLETILTRQTAGPETAPMTETGGFAGMGEVGGMAGGGMMKVTGEITVHFDNKMFRTQVAQVVGEVIRTGEIRKNLVQQGFTNKINSV